MLQLSRLSFEEIELYFEARVWAAARQLSHYEVQRALADGRALGLHVREGDFASGEASLVPLDVTASPKNVKVVVPLGEQAVACFERDREHEVWEAVADEQIAGAFRELGPEATRLVRDATHPLALEISRLIPPGMTGAFTPHPEVDRILAAWSKDPRLLPATEYAKRVLELARITAEVYPRLGARPNLLEPDTHRVLVRIGCRAKLGRPTSPESLTGLPSYRELAAKFESQFTQFHVPTAGVVVKVGSRTLLLPLRERQEVDDRTAPTEARAMIACGKCAASTLLIAPVEYETHDDDHFGRFELWYRSHHEGACPECGAKLELGLGYTLTEITAATPHVFFLELDRVEARAGTLHASASF